MAQSLRLAAYVAALGSALLLGTTALSQAASLGEHLDDAGVTTKIKAELLASQALKSFEIHVDTSPTTIYLSGFVPLAANRIDAERIALGDADGRAIRDDIIVR